MTEAAPHPATDRFRRLVRQALAAIPSHREPARSVTEIARRLCEACDAADRPGPEEAEAAVRSALAVLDVFGALATSDEGYRTAGQVSTYFLRSLTWYVEHGIPLVGGWQARGAQGDAGAPLLDRAPDFLDAMERRRLSVAARLGLDAPASRRQEAVLILVKGVLDGEVYYLHQFDADARRYQLIGGRVEPGEAPLAAALRELSEELGIAAGRAALHPLIEPPACIMLTAISPTYGALTDYAFSAFGAALDTCAIVLRPGDCWLSVAEMLDEGAQAGRMARDAQLMRALDRRLPGGLRGAPVPPVEICVLPNYWDHVGSGAHRETKDE
ncbi:MAG: NUDIX domain-containing protein [Candidatus Brachytrichaceae bacterium NZ_4S206]|jgi:8-oxo-dGTP pyrophosphatase MutT (NUDIX family)